MFFEFVKIALLNINQNRFRTLLTLLAIIIGAFSVVLMTSLAESGLNTVLSGLESMGGARLIFLGDKQPERMKEKAHYSSGLSNADFEELYHTLPYVREMLFFRQMNGIEVTKKGTHHSKVTTILGTDNRFIRGMGMMLSQGRNFTSHDVGQAARVAILSKDLVSKLFPNGMQSTEPITLFSQTFKVVGILSKNEKLGVQIGFDWNDFVLIPDSTLQSFQVNKLPMQVLISTVHTRHNDVVKRIINAKLLRRHHQVDDFQMLDFNVLMRQFNVIFSTVKTVVALIAALALVIGGIGIMNILMVSIKQRVKEIGIRRAVGARPSHIFLQFILEALMLCVTGGILGVILAVGVKSIADLIITHFLASWTAILSTWSIVFAIISATILALIFGWFPAKRAATLPIDWCLRQERG